MKKPTIIEIGVKAMDDAGIEKEFYFNSLDDLILDLRSIAESPTYSHMKQAIEDLVNELEEINS